MATPTAKDCHAMTSYFVKKWKGRYGTEPVVNRHSARWIWSDILRGMSPSEAKELIDYYFTTANTTRHSWEWFAYNYEKLLHSRAERDEDLARTQRLREESERRAREWRERGNKTITTSD